MNNEKRFYTTVECIHRVYGCIWRKHYETYVPNTEKFLKKAKIDIATEISSLLRELVEVEELKKYLPDTDVYITNNFWNEHPIPYEKLLEIDLLDVYLKDTIIQQEAVWAIDDMDVCNDIDELIKYMYSMIGTDTNIFMCLYKEFMKRIHDDSFMEEYDIYKVPFLNNHELRDYLKITNNGKKMTRLSFNDGRVAWANKPNDLRHIKNEDGEFWFDENGKEYYAIFPENCAFDEYEEWHDSNGHITHRRYDNGWDSEIWYNKRGEVIKQRNITGIGVTNKYVRNRTCERITDTSKPGITKEKWINGDHQVTLSYTRDLRKDAMTSEFIFNYNSDVLIIDENHNPIRIINHDPVNNRTYIQYANGTRELYGRDGVIIYKKKYKRKDDKHRPYKRKQHKVWRDHEGSHQIRRKQI